MLNISQDNIDDQFADKQLYSLKILKTPHLSIQLARVFMVLSVIAIAAMFMPWQQNIRGGGKLTALDPSNRPQTLQSIIPGRIEKWNVSEGQFVLAGDTIVQLAETKDKFFDPQILVRMKEQITAKQQGIQAYENQIGALRDGLAAKMAQARNKIRQTSLKVQSDSIALEAEKINYANAENIFSRNKIRYESGNIALTKYQELENKFNMTRAKLVEQENKYLQSQADLSIVKTDLYGIQADYSEKISKTTSILQEATGELSKLINDYSNVQIRRNQYALVAPQNGYVVKALKAGIGENIKEGEAVATIQPSKPDLAVEMYVQAMDVPLIERGRKVRVQFDGWPALQFSGWPSVSVGTFGGIVQVIDRVNNGTNQFRILVTPDPGDDPWPEQLRLGSGVKGWVMLENVRVWYEIWRQLNGFPPSLYTEPGGVSDQVVTKSEGQAQSKDKK